MDSLGLTFDEELSSFEHMMFRAEGDARSRPSMMFIETLDVVPDLARLREQIERTSRVLPRLRQHVVAPLVPLSAARWVFDPDFSLDYHFRRIALPAPGTFRQLLDLAQVVHATPLDLTRPLWEVTLVEGLEEEDSKAALLWKLSHSITDGVGGMVLDQMIHGDLREPVASPMPSIPVPEDVTALDLTTRAVRRLPFSLLRGSVARIGDAVGMMGRGVRHPVASTSAVVKFTNEVRSLAGSPATEPSPLLKRRSLNRRYEALDFPLSQIRGAAKSQGCSVNDAYLAAIAGALGRYHEHMGVPIDAIALALPVNARDASSKGAGNEWSAITIRLPLGEPDVARRLKAVREQVLTARTETTLNPTKIIAPLVSWLPQQMLAGGAGGSMGFDVQASNVPGSSSDRFIAGARITRSVPIGPLPGVAMMATMVSFSGQCFVGFNYDTAAFADGDLLVKCLRQGFEEVLGLAEPPGESAGKNQDRARSATPRAAASPSSTKEGGQ